MVAEAGPLDVIVVANSGRTDVSSWGGILSVGAAVRSVRGVVTDGACRDVSQAREQGTNGAMARLATQAAALEALTAGTARLQATKGSRRFMAVRSCRWRTSSASPAAFRS